MNLVSQASYWSGLSFFNNLLQGPFWVQIFPNVQPDRSMDTFIHPTRKLEHELQYNVKLSIYKVNAYGAKIFKDSSSHYAVKIEDHYTN